MKYSSIVNYLDGIRWLHVMFDYPPPPLSHCRVQLTLRGLKRLLSASVQRKLPITPSILLALRNVMDFSLPLHRALWAAFLLGFFSFFRKSNITLQVPRNSLRTNTCHAPTSISPRGASSSLSNGPKFFNSAKGHFSFHWFPYRLMLYVQCKLFASSSKCAQLQLQVQPLLSLRLLAFAHSLTAHLLNT